MEYKKIAKELYELWINHQEDVVIGLIKEFDSLKAAIIGMHLYQLDSDGSIAQGITSVLHAQKILKIVPENNNKSNIDKTTVNLKLVDTPNIVEPISSSSNKIFTNCSDCGFSRIIPDPDLDDSFNYDDEAMVCTKMKNPTQKSGDTYVANRQEHRIITSCCRPYETKRDAITPSWCPLNNKTISG